MKNEDPESELWEKKKKKKLKKSFTEYSLQFHQQKSASRFWQEFVGRPLTVTKITAVISFPRSKLCHCFNYSDMSLHV